MLKKFILFLKLAWKDWRNPPEKRPYGIMCFVGLPGSGKTLSLVHELLIRKKQFPTAKIYTNFGFKYEDGTLSNWQQLIELHNGADGVIFGIDEVHSIFGRNDWRDMPKGILTVFSQNRKYAKEFICTAQAYDDIVIDMRRRCNWIVDCKTIRNRWVFQRAFTSVGYSLKDDLKKTSRRIWKSNFIATDFIYDAYDTYKVIENIMEGAKPIPEEITIVPKFKKRKIRTT